MHIVTTINHSNSNSNSNSVRRPALSSLSLIEIKQHDISSTLQIPFGPQSRHQVECDQLCSKIGQRVKIYWSEDKQWYFGTIKDYKASSKKSLIVYDDSESEWLNLTKSGSETVEFLYDPIEHRNQDELAEHMKIGSKISSGKVVSTFNHGCIANLNLKLENKCNANFTAIAFDNRYLEYLRQQHLLSVNALTLSATSDSHTNSHSNCMDILQLLHLCQFDQCMLEQLEQSNSNTNSNGVSRTQSRRNRRTRSRNETHIAQTAEHSAMHTQSNDVDAVPSWIHIGCTAHNDAITKMDSESHINLIHNSNEYRNYKQKSSNGYTANAASNRMNKRRSSKSASSGVYGRQHGEYQSCNNNNNATKKCNGKSVIDLKAIYPLNKIRQQNHDKQRTVIVIGAGISGLSCARELMHYGYNVVVLEARNRAGGRILTDYSMGLDANHGCDVGGGWIHGVERNPLTRLVERLKLTLHSTSGDIQMYDHCGIEVDSALDTKVEKEFNGLLDRISKENEERYKRIHGEQRSNGYHAACKHHSKSKDEKKNLSLGETLNSYLNTKKKKMSEQEYNLWHWHFSNLEYSNAADLNHLSLTDWDQDDEYAFNGDHCLIQEGYGKIIEGLKQNVNVKYNNVVTKIDWSTDKVVVHATKNQQAFVDPHGHSRKDDDEEKQIPETDVVVNSTDNAQQTPIVKKNNINVGVRDDAEITNGDETAERKLENLSHVDLCKDTDDEDHDADAENDGTVPIYAMLSKTGKQCQTYQFVKLRDVKGMPHYKEQVSINGHNGSSTKVEIDDHEEDEQEEQDEDDDIAMSSADSRPTANDEDEEDEDEEEEGEMVEYTADAVVVTLPLGILKGGDVEFTPALPKWKQQAIDAIGFGLLNKVFLKFERVFWDIENDYVGYASSTHGEFYLFVNLVPVSGTPVLMSLISGSFAEQLEQQTDEEVVEYAMKILQTMFAKKSAAKNAKSKKIPQPTDYYVTRWKQDKYARGSYSYIAKGCNGDHYDKLSYSVKDRVYFAGEATIRKWPASVHGAYLSGIREARNIMNAHYIHNEEAASAASATPTKPTRRKRGRKPKESNANSTSNHKLSTPLIKAGLAEYPTDTIFKPIKDQQLRISHRRNFNKYSSKNQSARQSPNKPASKKRIITATKRRRGRPSKARKNSGEDQDISSMSDTSSVASQEEKNKKKSEQATTPSSQNDDELVCTLCGGSGYLSDDLDAMNSNNRKEQSNGGEGEEDGKKRNKYHTKNLKLIGPFLLDSSANDKEKEKEKDKEKEKEREIERKCYIHFGCGLWSPDINNQENQWYNVISCIKRSKLIKCCYCGEFGASVHCHNQHCLASYHPECAHTTQWWDFDRPDEGPLFFCIKHREDMLALHVVKHETKLLSIDKNHKNPLRSPRPPAIRQ